MKRVLTFLIVVVTLFFLKTFSAMAMVDGVTVTVSDWNVWWSPPNWGIESQLAPYRWHYRLPFYSNIISSDSAEVRDDNQSTMDKEIQFAAAAGIDSLSFFYYEFMPLYPTGPNPSNGNHTVRLYLSSQHKNRLKFSITAELYHIAYPSSSITPAMWDNSFTPHMVDFMKDPQYQKVLGNRPIIYFLGAKSILSNFGSQQNFRDAIQRFRNAAQTAGLENPYIVDLDGDPNQTSALGMDAVSEYTSQWGTSRGYDNGTLWPYSDLVASNQYIWNLRAGQTMPFVPNLNLGWDYRPTLPADGSNNYGNSPVFAKATPDEIANHISNAIEWTKNHGSDIPAQTIYIYAWAENSEGGWLAPTVYEGDARLQAISKKLKGSNFTSPRYKGRDINGDNSINISDYYLLKSDFGKNLDPIPNNSDITADGKVDIYDYNELVTFIGK